MISNPTDFGPDCVLRRSCYAWDGMGVLRSPFWQPLSIQPASAHVRILRGDGIGLGGRWDVAEEVHSARDEVRRLARVQRVAVVVRSLQVLDGRGALGGRNPWHGEGGDGGPYGVLVQPQVSA
jgi:hypothetical protein